MPPSIGATGARLSLSQKTSTVYIRRPARLRAAASTPSSSSAVRALSVLNTPQTHTYAAVAMKLALVSASLVLALAHHGAHAQFGKYGIPSCATGCMEQAAIQGRCGFTDIACICTALSNSSVMATAVTCERKACLKTETATGTGAGTAFEQFLGGHCKGPGSR